jgi:hypothetical protein
MKTDLSPWRCCLRLILVLSLISLSSTGIAQLINARFITSVYAWEQFDTVDVSRKYARGTQSLILDIAQSDFSIHTHLQGAAALQRKLDEVPDFRAYYLYARMRNIGDAVDFSFGRLPYFAGVGNGTLDGALTTARLAGNTFRVTLYGGQNLRPDLGVKDWVPLKHNFVVGGQVLTTAIPSTRLGISYVNRQRERSPYEATRADSLFNPFTVFVQPPPDKEQLLSGDVSYSMNDLTLYGRYDHDLNGEKTQRGQVGVRYNVSRDLSVSGDFVHRAPRLPFGTFFTLFSTSTINEFEVGGDYVFMPEWRGFLRGAFVQYDGENSTRYTLGVAHNHVGLTYRGNTGYAGELQSVSVYGAYPLLDRMIIPTAGITFTSYKLSSDATREDALAGILGATFRPLQWIALDVQGQYIKNRIFDNDLRLFARLSVWFSERLDIF